MMTSLCRVTVGMSQEACKPCAMQFDYIAKFETMAIDLKDILPKFGASDFINAFPTRNAGSTPSTFYKNMYSNISSSILQQVLTKYRVDADMFGYDIDEYIKIRQ